MEWSLQYRHIELTAYHSNKCGIWVKFRVNGVQVNSYRIFGTESYASVSVTHRDTLQKNHAVILCSFISLPLLRRLPNPNDCYDDNGSLDPEKKNRSTTTILRKGLKRSVTTLRGGSLGYAEIVAVKVPIPPHLRR